MSRQLYIYSRIAPNKDEDTHYFLGANKTYADYLGELNSFLIGTLTIDKYLMNTDTAKLKATNALLSSMDDITYIVDYDAETHYFRAYHVNKAIYQSGYIECALSVDLWAISLESLAVQNLHVTRCNRLLDDTGIYDEIKGTDTAILNNYDLGIPLVAVGGELSKSAVSIVFLVSYANSTTVFGDNLVTRTALFYATLQELYDLVSATHPSMNSLHPIELAKDLIGGIHQIQSSKKAQVIRAWLVPTATITDAVTTGYNAFPVPAFQTNCTTTEDHEQVFYTTSGDVTTYYLHSIIPHYYIKNVDIIDVLSSFHTEQYARDQIATHSMIVGTGTNGIKLTRRLHPKIKFLFTFESDNVSVSISDGTQQKDISKAFELSLTTNNDTPTTLGKSLSLLSNILGIMAGAAGSFAGVMSGSPTGALVAGTGFARAGASLAGMFGSPALLPHIDAGDAEQSFCKPLNPRDLFTPFRYSQEKSSYDEIENAFYKGVNYDSYQSSFYAIAQKPYIHNTTWTFDNVIKTYARLDETYAVIDSLHIRGVQEDAKKYIKGELARGVFFKII